MQSRMIRVGGRTIAAAICALALAVMPGAAIAAETATYTYDALGRLTAVSIAGGPAAGTNAGYTYDAAGNRSQTTVSTPLALKRAPAAEQVASRSEPAPARSDANHSGAVRAPAARP